MSHGVSAYISSVVCNKPQRLKLHVTDSWEKGYHHSISFFIATHVDASLLYSGRSGVAA